MSEHDFIVRDYHGTRRKAPTKEEDEETKDAKNEAHTRSSRVIIGEEG
jgi:hypothetical protein